MNIDLKRIDDVKLRIENGIEWIENNPQYSEQILSEKREYIKGLITVLYDLFIISLAEKIEYIERLELA